MLVLMRYRLPTEAAVRYMDRRSWTVVAELVRNRSQLVPVLTWKMLLKFVNEI